MIRQSIFCVAALLSATISSPAMCAEWESFYVDPDGVNFSIDMTSIEINGNKRNAWVKSEFKSARESEQGLLKQILQRLEINCLDRVQRRLAEIGNDPNGKAIYKLDETAEIFRIRPETVAERRMVKACGYKPKK